MSDPNPDRRAHPRRDIRIDVDASSGSEGTMARLVASNLSAGGLYCTSPADYPEMTRLAVRLLLPVAGNGDVRPLDAEAVVVRRRVLPAATNGDRRYELALYFTRIEDDARRQLATFLA